MSYWILPAVPLKEEEQGLTFTQRLHELDLLGATVGITAIIQLCLEPGTWLWLGATLHLRLVYCGLLALSRVLLDRAQSIETSAHSVRCSEDRRHLRYGL
jgi:hypothetical protein